MKDLTNHISTVVILAVSFLVVWLLATVANATYIEQDRMRLHAFDPSPTEVVLDMIETRNLINYLRTNDWVKSYVTDEDLESYILIVKQYCQGRTYVTPQLILAMIAVESRFDTTAHSSGAYGLMQLWSLYHKGRLAQFKVEEYATTEDFYNPALNIAAGIDYIEEIFSEVMTYDRIPKKQAFSLMWYNQGPLSASATYDKGIISDYAKTITNLAEDLGHIFSKGDVYRGSN